MHSVRDHLKAIYSISDNDLDQVIEHLTALIKDNKHVGNECVFNDNDILSHPYTFSIIMRLLVTLDNVLDVLTVKVDNLLMNASKPYIKPKIVIHNLGQTFIYTKSELDTYTANNLKGMCKASRLNLIDTCNTAFDLAVSEGKTVNVY